MPSQDQIYPLGNMIITDGVIGKKYNLRTNIFETFDAR